VGVEGGSTKQENSEKQERRRGKADIAREKKKKGTDIKGKIRVRRVGPYKEPTGEKYVLVAWSPPLKNRWGGEKRTGKGTEGGTA